MYGQSYVANLSSVDGKSAFLREKPQHDHIQHFQSFARFREPGLITELPAEEKAAVDQDPRLLALKNQIAQLRGEKANHDDIRAAKAALRNLHRKISRKRLEQYQLDWVKRRRDWKVLTRGKERADDDVKRDLSEILAVIMPEYSRLVRTMISSAVVSHEERKQAVQDLCTLVARDCTTLYRPDEEPVNGMCPVNNCTQAMKRLSTPSDANIC